MATKRLPVSLIIRNDTPENWARINPILDEGEYGLERNTLLLKIGDGVRDWNHLPYLNKLNTQYFKKDDIDGSLTFNDTFLQQLNNIIAGSGGDLNFIITDDPEADTDPVNLSYLRRYIADQIAHAGHLKRAVVEELPLTDIDENTIYMVPREVGVGYEEYMYIEGQWDMVGNTGDSSGYVLPVATANRLGGVKASEEANKINVTPDGFMTLNQVSTSLLYVPTGDVLIIHGGTA